jgi:hypothetical protein
MTERIPERLMFVGRVSESPDKKSYEIELQSGLTLLLDAEAADKVEEYVDPQTGLPVANIYLRAGKEVSVALRVRITDEASRSEQLPFAFSGSFVFPTIQPYTFLGPISVQRFRDTLTCKCTGGQCDGDCNVVDDNQIKAAIPFS